MMDASTKKPERVMAVPSQQPLDSTSPHPAAALVDTTARWLGIEEDIALGCECADPTLQIERWGQEALVPAATSS
jgi:hypothetical protein